MIIGCCTRDWASNGHGFGLLRYRAEARAGSLFGGLDALANCRRFTQLLSRFQASGHVRRVLIGAVLILVCFGQTPPFNCETVYSQFHGCILLWLGELRCGQRGTADAQQPMP